MVEDYLHTWTYSPPNGGGTNGAYTKEERSLLWTPEPETVDGWDIKFILDVDGFFYPSQIITVKESLVIQTTVELPGLINQDISYYQPKKYLGTWQSMTDGGGIEYVFGGIEGSGFLTNETMTLVYYHRLSVAPSQQHYPMGSGKIDQCGFDLEKHTIIKSNPYSEKDGFRPVGDAGLFGTRLPYERSTFEKGFTSIKPAFKRVGLVTSPGSIVSSITHRLQSVKDLTVKPQDSMGTEHCQGDLGSCDLALNEYIKNHPPGQIMKGHLEGPGWIHHVWNQEGCTPRDISFKANEA
jgi:hypothetical protein